MGIRRELRIHSSCLASSTAYPTPSISPFATYKGGFVQFNLEFDVKCSILLSEGPLGAGRPCLLSVANLGEVSQLTCGNRGFTTE